MRIPDWFQSLAGILGLGGGSAMNDSDRYSRQSFLGENAQEIISSAKIGVIGLGGGGSHIVQQLAHVGFLNYCIYDADRVEYSNLNRLVGATEKDAENEAFKVDVAKRLIKGLQSKAHVQGIKKRWQDDPEPLKRCSIIFGCVDGFQQRRELETMCRRYLITLIDIGLDVHPHPIPGGAPSLAGQVILSIPGHACMRCYRFLSDELVGAEIGKYGAAGINPQVVWSNGILASTAVGLAINHLTNWTQEAPKHAYLSYNGNLGIMIPHPQLSYIPERCDHYSLVDTGDPVLKRV